MRAPRRARAVAVATRGRPQVPPGRWYSCRPRAAQAARAPLPTGIPSLRPEKSASAQLFLALRPAWLVLPGVASATASGARRARPVHLWRPRRRRPSAHTPHTRAPAGGRGVPLPSLALTPNWLRTVPSGVGGPGAGLTD